MWRLCIEDDQQNRTVVNLVRKTYSIGRAEDNGIRLTDRNISRKHAELSREDEHWVLKDLGSLTGCSVNDRRIDQTATVEHGDKLRFGDYLLTLTDESRQDETVRARSTEATEPPTNPEAEYYPERNDRLVVIEGPNIGAQYPLSATRLLLGRGEECDISLNDTSVSRVHADIERLEDGQYRISDQDSSNGLRINGVDQSSAVLDTGDVVELGDVFLKFIPKGLSFEMEARPHAATEAQQGGLVQRITSNPRVLGATAAAGLLVGLLVFGSFGKTDSPEATLPSPATSAVSAAGQLFAQGKFDEAHAQLALVPQSHELRDAPVFRQVEAAWADAQFEKAERTQSEDEQRRLLSLVASSESVDALRRKRAAQRLAQLNAANLDPEDLPQVSSKPDAGGAAPDFQIVANDSAPPPVKPAPRRPTRQPVAKPVRRPAAPAPHRRAEPQPPVTAAPPSPPTHAVKPPAAKPPAAKPSPPAEPTAKESDSTAIPVREFPGEK